jgi:hypothetical protein
MIVPTEAVLDELRQQTKWLKFLARRELSDLLRRTLRTAQERAAYEASNGQLGTREVGAAAGISAATVSRWWNRWRVIGIIEIDERGRASHLMSLESLGLNAAPGEEEGNE